MKKKMTKLFKSMHKIGIFVKKPESNFSNGCIQQALFIKQLVEQIGYHTDFVTIDPDYTEFSGVETTITRIDETSDLSMYKILIFVSATILKDHPISSNINRWGVKCVDLICGNLYFLHQEQFIFDKHHIMRSSFSNVGDESWILEMYPYMTEYVEFLTNKPTTLMPYVWNTDIIDNYLEQNKLDVSVDYDRVNREKMNILVFEPNMSIHKTCLVPLLIANRYHRSYPNRLNKVYVFCGNHVKDSNLEFIKNLEICKDGVLEFYDRMVMPFVLKIVQNNNNYLNTVVSHNIQNGLNFLHLELFHIGVPIVHNCEPFRANGLYYDDFSLRKAVSHLETVRQTFNNNEDYRKHVREIVDEYSPYNDQRKTVYKKHIERIMNVELCELQPDDDVVPSDSERLKQILQKNNRNSKSTGVVDTEAPCFGKGVVISVFDDTNVDDVYGTLESLKKTHNKFPVEIVCLSTTETYKRIRQHQLIKNHTQLPYDIDVLHATNDDGKKNRFSAIKMSSFEETLYIHPGQCIHVSPSVVFNSSIDTKSPRCRALRHVLKYSTLDPEVLNVVKSVIPDTNDLMMDTDLLYMKKSDVGANRLVNIMSSLDTSSMDMDTSTLFSIVTNEILGHDNYDTDLFATPYKTYVMGGIVQDKFKGCGRVHMDSDKSILASKVDVRGVAVLGDDTKKIMVASDSSVDFHITTDGWFGFKGKAVAKAVPKEFR